MLFIDIMKVVIKNILAGANTIGSILPSPPQPVFKQLHNPPASDADAIRSDWEAVGRDLKHPYK